MPTALADAAAALSRVAARALIGCQRIGDTVHGDLAMHIAMETFTIRFLCGFGENLPDGVVLWWMVGGWR